MKNLLLFAFIFQYCFLDSQTLTGTIATQPCNNNGVCNVTVAGLSFPITYTYYNGFTSVVHYNVNSLTDQFSGFSPCYPGSISCQASDGTNYAYTNVPYLMPFHVNVSYNNPICPVTTGTLSASTFSGSPGPFSYDWTDVITLANYQGNNAFVPVGTYSLSVNDIVTGCEVQFKDSLIDITLQSNINITFSATAANCSNGTASVTASGGVLPYTYQWSNGLTTPFINNLIAGNYTAIVTDALGCVNNHSQWFTPGIYVPQGITLNVNTSITNANCVQNNGSAIAFATGGISPYSYLWSNGQVSQTLSSAATGLYNVLATDANGCVGQGVAYIGASSPITVTYTANPSSCIASTGSVSLTINGGTPPYITAWNIFPAPGNINNINGLPPGNYGFTVTDANGCVGTGQVSVPSISTIYGSLFTSTVTCPTTTGTILSNVSGTNPPFTYNWNNGSTNANIYNVPEGNYSCVITDAVGCSITKYTGLYAVSPINIGMNVSQASCKFASDGVISANATGGTAPYSYQWSNGQTGPTATGLTSGDYWVTATDANGCLTNDYAYVGYNPINTSCINTIIVLVYKDANSNCTKDAGEFGIPNVMIHCSNFGYAFTNVGGSYTFTVPAGTYTLSESVNSHYPLSACQSNSISVSFPSGGSGSLIKFANNVLPQHDLHFITNSFCSVPIPGNPYYQRIIVENNGTVPESGIQISYVSDGQLGPLVSGSNVFVQPEAASYPNWYSLQNAFGSLTPGAYGYLDLSYNTPTNIPLGTVVNFYDSTAHMAPINTSWLLDETPWDNVQNYQQTVVGSFDPNFKEVSPQGSGAQGYIASKDSILSYVIHFQNEGTYFAQNISVVDTLDSDLDWTALRPGYADHKYTTTVSENGVITFKFANINLPWKSQYGDVMSSGMVTYTIKRKHNAAQGTQFKNKAAIYFDYNAPVITNTTLNTLNDILASVEEKVLLDNGDVVLYPNPAADVLSITINAKESNRGSVNILDINGKVVSSQTISLDEGKNVIRENTSDLPSGIYLVQVKCKESFITKKLVVIK